ncbi:hypothetical protein D3C78_1108010 [compost metagenome]
MRLHLTSEIVALSLNALLSQLIHESCYLAVSRFPQRYKIHIQLIEVRKLCLLVLKQQNRSFKTKSKSNAGLIGSANLGYETVITSAPANRIDCANSFCLEFKSSMRVIIEPAHQTVVDLIRNTHIRQILLHLIKMLLAFLIQTVKNGRRIRKMLLIDLAVKNAERIAIHARLAILAQQLTLRFKKGQQPFTERRTNLRRADRVHLDTNAL